MLFMGGDGGGGGSAQGGVWYDYAVNCPGEEERGEGGLTGWQLVSLWLPREKGWNLRKYCQIAESITSESNQYIL